MRRIYIVLLVFSVSFSLNAQSDKVDSVTSSNLRWVKQDFGKERDVKVTFGGYTRFLLHHRVLEGFAEYDSITNLFIPERKISMGDGNREPIMMLNTSLTGKSGASVFTDFYIFTPYLGLGNLGNEFGNNIMLNLAGSIPTKFGTYTLRAGGVQWAELSDFTMGSVDLNRYSMFIRTPWEGAGASNEKYKGYYNNGTINLDQRFTSVAFKGFIFDGANLPEDFGFSMLFGKNQTNVYDGSVLPVDFPNYTIAGNINKRFAEKHRIALNTVNSVSLTNIEDDNAAGYNMITLTHRVNVADVVFSGETGIGTFYSATEDRSWDPGVKFKIEWPKERSFFPMDLEFYYIGLNFVNNVGAFLNTSVPELSALVPSTDPNAPSALLQPFASPITNVGFLANNRFGLNYNAEFEIKPSKTKFNLGYSLSGEIENLGPDISVGHRINGFSLSRLYFFRGAAGPNGRLGTFFRGAYDVIAFPEIDSTDNKRFNTVELQAKQQIDIKDRSIYFFYFGSFNSVQGNWAGIPEFSDKAWLRAYYNEFETYLPIFPKTFLSGYVGLEHIKANEESVLDDVSAKPTDQFSYAYGIGLDLDIAKNTGLYIRQRWFNYKDKSFSEEKLSGRELDLELKVFF